MLTPRNHFEDISFPGDINVETLKATFKNMVLRNYARGCLVFRPHEPSCENLFYLIQGKVEIFRITAEGKRVVIRQLLPGSLFGIRGLVLGRSYQTDFAEATKNSCLGVITKEEFNNNFKNHDVIIQHIVKILSHRIYRLENRLIEALCIPVRIRLAYYLVTNSDSSSGLINNITHEEIGERIGAFVRP
jgi:CRP-like cAMP-binding protein